MLPNIDQSISLILTLLDDVVQRPNLNLPVQVQAIQGLTQSVKALADVSDRPDLTERMLNLLAKTNPEAMTQVGQMGQIRMPDDTPQVTDNLQRPT
jgi:hypothetical protein